MAENSEYNAVQTPPKPRNHLSNIINQKYIIKQGGITTETKTENALQTACQQILTILPTNQPDESANAPYQEQEEKLQLLLNPINAQPIWQQTKQKIINTLNEPGLLNPEAYTQTLIKSAQNKIRKILQTTPIPTQTELEQDKPEIKPPKPKERKPKTTANRKTKA